MRRYNLMRVKMANVIRTPRSTFGHWLDDDVNPPPCLLALMDLLEAESRARTRLGVHAKQRSAPRGRPFRRGNEFRFNDRRRRQAILGAARSKA
jgi:hypothetical protein